MTSWSICSFDEVLSHIAITRPYFINVQESTLGVHHEGNQQMQNNRNMEVADAEDGQVLIECNRLLVELEEEVLVWPI